FAQLLQDPCWGLRRGEFSSSFGPGTVETRKEVYIHENMEGVIGHKRPKYLFDPWAVLIERKPGDAGSGVFPWRFRAEGCFHNFLSSASGKGWPYCCQIWTKANPASGSSVIQGSRRTWGSHGGGAVNASSADSDAAGVGCGRARETETAKVAYPI